jgi:hypothetical protein
MGTAIGVVLGAVVTVLASRYYFRRSTNKSLRVYGLLNSFVFAGIAPDVRKQLKFVFEGRDVRELQQLVFLVANDGERAIRDVLEPLALTIPHEVELLDASIVHKHPGSLTLNLVIDLHSGKFTKITFDFPLLNKREFFVVKLLLSGHLNVQKLVFRLLADDLPRTLHVEQLPPSAYRETSYKFEWGLALVALGVWIIPAWVLYSARLLQRAYPMLFPYPWASFVVSARSLFLVVAGSGVVLLFAVLGFMMLGAATFGGDFPPQKKRFPLPKALGQAVFPYERFLLDPTRVDNSGGEPPDPGPKGKE